MQFAFLIKLPSGCGKEKKRECVQSGAECSWLGPLVQSVPSAQVVVAALVRLDCWQLWVQLSNILNGQSQLAARGPRRSKPVGLTASTEPLFHACFHKHSRCTRTSPWPRANVAVHQLPRRFLANQPWQFVVAYISANARPEEVNLLWPACRFWYTAARKERFWNVFSWDGMSCFVFFSFLGQTKIHPH